MGEETQVHRHWLCERPREGLPIGYLLAELSRLH